MPNPSSGVSPDLGARLLEIPGCGRTFDGVDWDGKFIAPRRTHVKAIYRPECAACRLALVAAIRAETRAATLEEAAKVCQDYADAGNQGTEYSTGRQDAADSLATRLRALTGSQTPQ